LPPNESANLCFAFPGRYVYTVRWNPPLTGHANKITGSIMIE
jgi:hypothetical protein